MPESLKYQCNVTVGGAVFSCIESYESVFERLRSASFRFHDSDEEAGMNFMEPIELTVGAKYEEDGESRLVRAAFAPQAISSVTEIPEDLRNDAP